MDNWQFEFKKCTVENWKFFSETALWEIEITFKKVRIIWEIEIISAEIALWEIEIVFSEIELHLYCTCYPNPLPNVLWKFNLYVIKWAKHTYVITNTQRK